MSLSVADDTAPQNIYVKARKVPPSSANETRRSVMAVAAWHSLLWLVIANLVGVLLASMLLFPDINSLLGQWTYGRWMPVHLNLQLYGWCSLPLVAFLFSVYGADQKPAAAWCRPVLWIWSIALGIGALSWLSGHSSGKLFLDWTGYPRVLFPMSLLSLWALLTYSLISVPRHGQPRNLLVQGLKIIGLSLLLFNSFSSLHRCESRDISPHQPRYRWANWGKPT